jgi:hypothetical protein
MIVMDPGRYPPGRIDTSWSEVKGCRLFQSSEQRWRTDLSRHYRSIEEVTL